MEVDKPIEKMDVDDADPGASTSGNSRKQILAKSIQPSVVISLHPLVLMNVSEHWTRIRAQEGKAEAVYGALIGKQEGRKIEIFNSFELRYETIEGDVIINRDYYNTKEEQCKSFQHIPRDLITNFCHFQISKFSAIWISWAGTQHVLIQQNSTLKSTSK